MIKVRRKLNINCNEKFSVHLAIGKNNITDPMLFIHVNDEVSSSGKPSLFIFSSSPLVNATSKQIEVLQRTFLLQFRVTKELQYFCCVKQCAGYKHNGGETQATSEAKQALSLLHFRDVSSSCFSSDN